MYFSTRSQALELMDDPNLKKEALVKAYQDINRCNTLLGGTTITTSIVKKLIKKHPKKSYTIYDVGCGDGHMLRKIASLYNGESITLNLVGIDIREDVLAIARKASSSFGNITYTNQNVLALEDDEQCDILLCTLTLHHFPEKDLKTILSQFERLARIGVVINDLERSKLAYVLFRLFSIFFIRTKIAKIDGLISIRKGFIKKDLINLSKSLKRLRHHIQWKWAFRYVWVMESTKGSSA